MLSIFSWPLDFQLPSYSPIYTEFLIILNTLLICTFITVFGLHCLLYGLFEPAESEELYARFVPATLESIITVIILDIDVDTELLWLFSALLAGKLWLWIGEWRVESLHQARMTQTRTYFCVLTGLLLSLLFEIFMVGYIFHAAQRTHNTKLVTMFSFEHAVLSVSVVSTTLSAFSLLEEVFPRIHAQSIRPLRPGNLMVSRRIVTPTATDMLMDSDGACPDIAAEEHKDRWRWVISLPAITECAVLFVSLSYCLVCLVSYKRPIITSHIFATSLSLRTRLLDSLNYRRALHAISGRYYDATADQIDGANICAICYERMWPWQQDNAATGLSSIEDSKAPCLMCRAKRLPCGHLFHFACLQKWFEERTVCPLCQGPVYLD